MLHQQHQGKGKPKNIEVFLIAIIIIGIVTCYKLLGRIDKFNEKQDLLIKQQLQTQVMIEEVTNVLKNDLKETNNAVSQTALLTSLKADMQNFFKLLENKERKIHTSLGVFQETLEKQQQHLENIANNQPPIKQQITEKDIADDLSITDRFHKSFSLSPLVIEKEIPITTTPRLAILVAFRDGCGKENQGSGREANLRDFRAHMEKHLAVNNPKLDYVIIVAEQIQKGIFNKGVLFNSAFLAAIRLFQATYVVFHDVDQVPESPKNDYALRDTPEHLCSMSEQFGYKMAYDDMVGGALMMTAQDTVSVNGFSNSMDGWGLEDDDMYRRISQFLSGKLNRPRDDRGRYHVLSHPRVMDLDVGDNYKLKYELLGKNVKEDGLNTVEKRATLQDIKEHSPRYLRFLVEVAKRDGSKPDECL